MLRIGFTARSEQALSVLKLQVATTSLLLRELPGQSSSRSAMCDGTCTAILRWLTVTNLVEQSAPACNLSLVVSDQRESRAPSSKDVRKSLREISQDHFCRMPSLSASLIVREHEHLTDNSRHQQLVHIHNDGLQAPSVHRGVHLERRPAVRSCSRCNPFRVHRDPLRELQQVGQGTCVPSTCRLVQQRSCIRYVRRTLRQQARSTSKSLRRCS